VKILKAHDKVLDNKNQHSLIILISATNGIWYYVIIEPISKKYFYPLEGRLAK
jgi:hypothetical protein